MSAARSCHHPTHKLDILSRFVAMLLCMARQRTRIKVHDAVLSLARDIPVGKITMEGIAARAGISRQTLYRTWPSTGAVFFDALLARSENDDRSIIVPTSDSLAA